MNLQLLNPFELQYPTEVEDWLEDNRCKTVRFNRFGTMLAIAGTDGRCAVLDFDTRSVLRDLDAHTATVTSVSWSRNGRYLLSTDKEGLCIFWDLIASRPKYQIYVDSAGGVLLGVMHPRNSLAFALCPKSERPLLVSVEKGQVQRIVLNWLYMPAAGENRSSLDPQASSNGPVNLGNHNFTALTFDRSGKRLVLGTSKGLLMIYNIRRGAMETTQQITNSGIRHIRFSRQGTDLLVNSGDRSIRLYVYDSGEEQRRRLKAAYSSTAADSTDPNESSNLAEALAAVKPTLTFIHKYQDQVNRVQWNECCFTCDGEHVIGGSAHKAEHNIYVWDKNATNLEKMLTGPKEQLLDLTWHPFRPIAVSVSVFGNIYIWGGKHREDWRNWNAFAPDFKELEENVEYVEREDEFDITVDDQPTGPETMATNTCSKSGTAPDEKDEEEVDIMAMEKFNPFNEPEDSELSDDGDELVSPHPPFTLSCDSAVGTDQGEEEVMFLPVILATDGVVDNDEHLGSAIFPGGVMEPASPPLASSHPAAVDSTIVHQGGSPATASGRQTLSADESVPMDIDPPPGT
ncbi:chromatin binding protein [Dimargaris verticillata]|uniref:Chromatin binding protein n=1 Tax=Dimargaris verticillata TaxID=2761393 RepID=A0A9W8EDL4_9FUNG|nr:chromatin binding protein [Dimargaris verticillata]